MTLYCCNETNVITEAPYEEISAGFCIVEKYEYVYQKELPRFRAMPGIKPYGDFRREMHRKRCTQGSGIRRMKPRHRSMILSGKLPEIRK